MSYFYYLKTKSTSLINLSFIFFITLLFPFFANAQGNISEQNLFFQDEIPAITYSITSPELLGTDDARGEFTIKVSVPKDHHAYLDKGEMGAFISLDFDFSGVESAGYKVSLISGPKGTVDKEFEATVLRGKGKFKYSITRVKGREYIIPPIKARSQICNDITKICFLPRTDDLVLVIKEISGQSQTEHIKSLPTSFTKGPTGSLPSSGGEGLTGKVTDLYSKYSQNYMLAFLFIIVAGLLSAATPCVYPMIPITSAIIMKRGESNKRLGIYHSLIYFVGIICVYMLLGYVAGMTGGAFNAIMQSPFINLFFAFLFSFFGLAMLGFFDFAIAETFTSRISSAVSQEGGFFNTFLMGMTAGLIISPCVGPVVFTLLIQVADKIAETNAVLAGAGGNISFVDKSMIAAQGGLMMSGFGIGIGIPFLLVGLLSNRMPKAGKWMDYVKYALGLVILYIAWTYYMKGVKTAQLDDQAAYTILVGIVAIFFSVYLGLFRPEKNRLRKGIAFTLLLPAFYFVYDGLSQAGIIGKDSSHTPIVKTTLSKDGYKIEIHENLMWYRDFEEAKKVAARENKPIFMDFFAYWCANCLEFEKLSVKNKKLNQSLGDAVLLKIYDTDPIFKTFRDNPIHRELKTGLPYFSILKSNGEFFWKGTQYDAVETMGTMIKGAYSTQPTLPGKPEAQN